VIRCLARCNQIALSIAQRFWAASCNGRLVSSFLRLSIRKPGAVPAASAVGHQIERGRRLLEHSGAGGVSVGNKIANLFCRPAPKMPGRTGLRELALSPDV